MGTLQQSQETRVRLLEKDPLQRETGIHATVLAWKIPQRNLAGYIPWGCKESDRPERVNNRKKPNSSVTGSG